MSQGHMIEIYEQGLGGAKGPLYADPRSITQATPISAEESHRDAAGYVLYGAGGSRYTLTMTEWEKVKPYLVADQDNNWQSVATNIMADLLKAQERIQELEGEIAKAKALIQEQGAQTAQLAKLRGAVVEAKEWYDAAIDQPAHIGEGSEALDSYYAHAESFFELYDEIVVSAAVEKLADTLKKHLSASPDVQPISNEQFEKALRSDMAEIMTQPADTPPPAQDLAQVIANGVAQAALDKAEAEKLKKSLGIAAPTDDLMKFANAMQADPLAPAKPDKPTSSNAISWSVTRVKRGSFFSKTSNSNRAMWTLFSEQGSVNVFDHADTLRDHKPKLEEAGYLSFFQMMKDGETLYWTQHPIVVSVSASGKFWDLKGIGIRNPDETPDEPSEHLTPKQLAACKEAKVILGRNDLVVFDTETTGIADDDEIVEIAGILVNHTSPFLGNTFQILIKPTDMKLLTRPGKKGKSAFDIHGIGEEMLKDAQHIGHVDVLNVLSEFLDKKAWATFNLNFDERMLSQSLEAVGLHDGMPESWTTYCIQELTNIYLGHEYTSLDEACKALGIERNDKHRAMADAEDALKVLQALAAKVPAENKQDIPF